MAVKYIAPKKHFKLGLKAFKKNDFETAQKHFEKASTNERSNALYMSYFGYSCALNKHEIGRGIDLCTTAIKRDVKNTLIYLHLGKIYLEAGNKKGAIRTFKRGLQFKGNDKLLNRALEELGAKQKPTLPFLKRSGFINRNLGTFFRKTTSEKFSARRPVSEDTESPDSASSN